MKAIEIARVIEEFAPVAIQETWDNSGFCIGNPQTQINGVLLALDCTPEVIQEAIEIGANMIITHHPLIFRAVKKITGATLVERMIAELIKRDIVLYSAHTNIDKVIDGVSGVMADRLCLLNREILDEDLSSGTGLGIIGELSVEMSSSDFIAYVKKKFLVDQVRVSRPLEKKIKRVAVCGGSGSSLIKKAAQGGASVLITGDISYHDFYCEDGFMLIDIGHYESEIGSLEILTSILRKKIHTFAVCKSEKNKNPIHYY